MTDAGCTPSLHLGRPFPDPADRARSVTFDVALTGTQTVTLECAKLLDFRKKFAPEGDEVEEVEDSWIALIAGNSNG